ncbi:MAG: DUF6798 domain-containing protein, partial [Pseudobdellovibrionaceae bacterium]
HWTFMIMAFLVMASYGWSRVRHLDRWILTSLRMLVLGVAIFQFYPAYDLSLFYSQFSRWKEVQLWIKKNTPPGSTILTPPGAVGFRIFSERSPFFEFRDGTQQFFDPRILEVLVKRMQVLNLVPNKDIPLEEAENYPPPLPVLQRLQREFEVNYMVVFRRVSSSMFQKNLTGLRRGDQIKLRYENPRYSIYSLHTGEINAPSN